MKSLLLVFLLFTFQANSQLTNGQVYNFAVGDVLQSRAYSQSYPYQYIYDSIVNKVVGNDTIIYTINRKDMAAGPPPYPQYQLSVITQVITNLNAPAGHFTSNNCSGNSMYGDSSYINECGALVNLRYGIPNGCFEPIIWRSILIEGLGGPYEMIYDNSSPYGWTRDLIYSRTAQWGECGTYYDMTLGIEDLALPQPELIKIVDILGNESEDAPGKLLIYLYSDGTTQKVFRVE